MTIIALDIDPQRGFSPLCPNELPIQGALSIVTELNAQAALADFRVLTKDAHSPNALWVVDSPDKMLQALPYDNADLTWVPHCSVGTTGFEVLPDLPAPNQYDYIVYKGLEKDMHPYGVCYHDLGKKISTGLLEWLTVKKAEVLLVGGLATDYCVKNSVLQLLAYSSEWKVVLNLAACRGISAETIDSAIHEMQAEGVIIVENAQQISSVMAI